MSGNRALLCVLGMVVVLYGIGALFDRQAKDIASDLALGVTSYWFFRHWGERPKSKP